MSDNDGCGSIIIALVLCVSVGALSCDEGRNRGRRDEWCRFSFDTAHTAADSLAVSRTDERCAALIRERAK